MKTFKVIGIFLGIIILLLLICIGILYFQNKSELTLPNPTGHFLVGRNIYDWVDSTRVDSLSPDNKSKRELLVWIWYPLEKNSSLVKADYMPKNLQAALYKHVGFIFSNFLSHDESKVIGHSMAGGKISSEQKNYPVIILRSGIGALATDYTSYAEDLASNGYVVVAADAPYSTTVVSFPDGRIINKTPDGNPGDQPASLRQEILINKLIKIWVADSRFMLDKLTDLNNSDPSGFFTGKLNLQSVGIFGHSFGGATAAEVCHDDKRFKAGIDIDGQPFGNVIKDGTTQPFMILLSNHSTEPGHKKILEKLKSMYERLPFKNRYWVDIPTARHFNFSDQSLLKNTFISRRIGAVGSINPRCGLQITSSIIVFFFDVYLKQEPDSILKNILMQTKEVKVVRE